LLFIFSLVKTVSRLQTQTTRNCFGNQKQYFDFFLVNVCSFCLKDCGQYWHCPNGDRNLMYIYFRAVFVLISTSLLSELLK